MFDQTIHAAAHRLLVDVLRAADTGIIPDGLRFAVRPAQEHGWVTVGAIALTDEGRAQLALLTADGG